MNTQSFSYQPLSSREVPLSVETEILSGHELNPAEEIKQKIQSAASSIMAHLGDELQRVAQSLSSRTYTPDNHLQIPLSGSNQSAHLANVSSEKFRTMGQKKEGVNAKEEGELERIGGDVKNDLQTWKALNDRCEELKRQLNEIKSERNELAGKKEKITKLGDQLGKTQIHLKNKLGTYENSIFSFFYQNTIKNIKTKMKSIGQSQKQLRLEATKLNESISSLQEGIYSTEKQQSSELIKAKNSYEKLLGGLERSLEHKMHQSHTEFNQLSPILTSIEDHAGNLLQHLKDMLGLVKSDETLSPESEGQLLKIRDEIRATEQELHADLNELDLVYLREEQSDQKIKQNEKIKDVFTTQFREGGAEAKGITQSEIDSITMVSQDCFSHPEDVALLADENDLDPEVSLKPEEKELLENSRPQLNVTNEKTIRFYSHRKL